MKGWFLNKGPRVWKIIPLLKVHFSDLYIYTSPHSSTLARKIPWTEEPGGLQFMGSLGVGHDWEISLWLFTFMHWRRKWQPTPVFLPGESQGWGSLVGCRLWGAQSQTRLKRLSSSSSSREYISLFFFKSRFDQKRKMPHLNDY